MTHRSILCTACCAAALAFGMQAARAANPPPVTGPYVDLGIGTNLMQNQKYDFAQANGARGGNLLFRPDYAGQLGVGYGLGNGFRLELDTNFFRNNAVKADDNVEGKNRAFGGVNTYGFMVNGYYDIPTGTNFVPFVGAGLGYQWQKFQHIGVADTSGDVYGGTYGSLAYDLSAGVAYDLPQVPGLAVTAQYQYMSLVHNRKYNDTGAVPNTQINVGQSGNHTFLVGLRYELFPPAPPAPAAAPAPTPVAAPAPAPARTYLVFFNWNKANLTPRAQQIVSEAAKASETTKVTRLNVNGYTDTSGAAAYNMKLSLRRAHNVAAQLVADGVSKNDIVIKGYGETHLLVPTGPNVREPQNRRVEIILH